MSAERLFKIINILLDKSNVSATLLAKEFEVSTRTIYRDIDKLTLAGIPVYTTQGRDGGVSLLPNYVINRALLTNQEQEQILLGLKNISGVYQGTDELLLKLEGLFKREQVDWIEVDLTGWGSEEQDTRLFENIKEAILNKKVITFTYLGSNQTRTIRTVKPIKLVFKASAWYMQAFDLNRNEYRTFKLFRIKEVVITKETFTDRLKAPDIAIDTKKVKTKCTLQFNRAIANRVYEEFTEDTIKEKGKYLIVTSNMPQDTWLVGYLLSFGKHCEVLEPKSLYDAVKKEIEKMKENYNI